MAFKKFESRYMPGPWITVSPPNFYFNQCAYELMSEPTRLALYYDAEEKRVAFMPVKLGDEHFQFSYKVCRNRTRGYFSIGAVAFIRSYAIKPLRKMHLSRDGDLFVINLKGTKDTL